jgi:hypothetical protein
VPSSLNPERADAGAGQPLALRLLRQMAPVAEVTARRAHVEGEGAGLPRGKAQERRRR